MIELGVVLLAGYMLMLGYLYHIQGKMMYFPPELDGQQRAVLSAFKPVEVETADGLTLRAFLKPPEEGKPVLVFFHGNASDPAWEVGKTFFLQKRGFGVLMATYRGYAGNPGQPAERDLLKDGEAYLNLVKKRFPGSPLILYGQSLGSAIAIDLASRIDVAALVLEVPFFSALSVASKAYPHVMGLGWLMRDTYRSDLKISRVTAPSLFLLAGQDEVVSLQSGIDLYEAANEPKTKIVFDKASHADVYSHGAALAFQTFMEKTFPR